MPRLDFALDARHPSIIVPLTGRDASSLSEQVQALAEVAADIVEWRVDHFADLHAVAGMAAQLAEWLPQTPILATIRTAAEGGALEVADSSYLELLTTLVASNAVDAVDVQFQHPAARTAIEIAHQHGVPVVASNHDFSATPEEDELVSRLAAMEDAGAEVAKIAVMPNSEEDVLTLLRATLRRFREANKPLITMSMGELGAITRLGGAVFGSAATFATAGASSAPGQLPAHRVRAVLDLIGRGTAGSGTGT